MKTVCLAAAAAFVLTACSAPVSRPGETFDRISQELAQAAASKPKAAPGSDAVGKAMMPPLQLDAPVAPTPEPRFNLAVNNAPASQVFMAIVSGTKYSMVFAPDLTGNLTLNLKNVTVREALDTIRELYGYEYRVQGSRIMIQSNALQSRIYQINYLASRRQGTSDTRVTSSAPSVVNPSGSSSGAAGGTTTSSQSPGSTPTGGTVRQSDSSRVQTISDNDFWKDLGNALGTIVGNQEGRSVILNPVSGVVLVKALPAELRAVENYLKATQLVVERQVMLEAKILEVRLSDSFQTGINWAKFTGHDQRWGVGVMAPGTTLGTTGTLTGSATGINSAGGTGVSALPGAAGAITTTALGKGFFGLAFRSADFAALLSFLESQGNVQVLSSPRIATINNQKAVLKVGADDYFVTGVSTTTTTSGTGNVVTPNITLQPFFSGISLDVTPQIDDEGNIILHVHPAVTLVEEKTKQVDLGSLGTFTLPLASSSINETDSIVRVQDGSIVAIGGLMSQEQSNNRNGLPGISRAPGLGMLFGQTGASQTKRELVILIKPTVIAGDSAWRQDLADTQDRLQALDPRRIQFQGQ